MQITTTLARRSILVLTLASGLACGSGPTTPLCRGDAADRGARVGRVSANSAHVSLPDGSAEASGVEYRVAGSDWREASVDASGARGDIVLNGLRPSTRYEYRVRTAATDALTGSFRTAPASDDGPVRFAALGDSGGGCEIQYSVGGRLVAEDPDLVLHTGDVLYSRDPADLDPLYFQPFAGILARAPFFLAPGNHDVDTVLLETLDLPTNDADGSERFYSFDWGSTHFVALDSNQALRPGSAQHEWLRRDLEATVLPWRVVYFHHPPYSSSRASYGGIRDALEPVFEEHSVDLVLNGHDHNYERTYPMRIGETVDSEQDPNYVDPRGTVYVVTGGGGRSLYASGTSAFTARSESSYHVTVVEIDGPDLRLRAVREDGSTLDEMSIHKPGIAPGRS